MLTAAQYDALIDPILKLYQGFEDSVLLDIARRLGNLDMTASASWQVQRLSESGMLYDDILKRLATLTHMSETELRDLFEKAGVKAMAFDDALYRKAGLNPIPLNLSPTMIEVLVAGIRRTQGMMQNLTMSTAIAGQSTFLSAADLAYMQVSTGTMSYQQAVRAGVKKLAADGIQVVQYSGRADQMDVAMRRAVLSGVAKTTGELQWHRADQMGQDLVQTSAHAGARNKGVGPMNHESWQGRIFSRSKPNTEYPDFITTTGYGTGPGLMGWNCRHSYYPFFPGISENAYKQATLDEFADREVTYNKQKMSFYDATQVQRGLERKIRYWKRQRDALAAAGQNNAPEAEAVKYYQVEMRSFIKQTGLVRQRVREQIV